MDKVSIVLPIYNEKDTIESVLSEWKKELEKNKIDYTFIGCEDGSTDGTAELLKKLEKKFRLTLDQKAIRRGYGGAVIDGINVSKTNYVLCIDSDGQCDPRDFSKFWKQRDKSDVLIGWRVKRRDSFHRKIYSKSFKTVFKFIFPTRVHDPSAPYVLFKKKTIIPYIAYLRYLKEGFWWGFIGMCTKKNLSLKEIPVNHRNRKTGSTHVYKLEKIIDIAIRNLVGLFRLRLLK
ncbi:MAG: glycosyltransferase family 2 protein [Patescibacteria group bacterium]